MPEIGDRLREARMRQGLDIVDAELKTKIRAKYLRALENEEFGMLPGPTFAKSFIRTYADFLGLDSQLLVEEYRSEHDPRDVGELQPFTPRPDRGRRARRAVPGPPRPGTALALVIFALLVFLLVLGLTGDEGDEGGGGTPESAGEPARSAAEKPARAKPRRRRAAAPARVSLRVAPAEATYVCVDDGAGNVIFEGTLEAPRAFRGRRLRINLGKTSATLAANGRRVPIVQGPEPVGFDFRPGSRREIPDEPDRPCA